MAYNNGFPMGYQPMYYPQQFQPQQPVMAPPQNPQPQQQNQQPMNNGIIWVQGEAGAKSYLVAPNTTVQLWDSEDQVIYLKSADASGMPSIKTLDYTIREMKQTHVPAVGNQNFDIYATKEDLDALRAEMRSMIAVKTSQKAAKKEVEENG